MHKRTAHRWRLLTIMTVGVFFAFGSFWLLQLITNGDLSITPDTNKSEPDYIVEKFSFVRMTPDGKPRYVIGGDKLTHLPMDDSADIVNPRVKGVAPGQAPMTIVAKQARVDHGNTQVHLKGDVDIVRLPTEKTQPMTLKSQALTIFPDEEIMTSDVAVDMVVGANAFSAIGMRANNATGEVILNRNVQILLPPKRR